MLDSSPRAGSPQLGISAKHPLDEQSEDPRYTDKPSEPEQAGTSLGNLQAMNLFHPAQPLEQDDEWGTNLYHELNQQLTYLDPEHLTHVHQAYLVALKAHAGQKRSSGEAYITHPLSVAIILAKMSLDYQSIVAALLHDVIEDTPITKSEIAIQFGETIAELVDGVTKLTKIEVSGQDETQAQNFQKMILAVSHDIRVILIKLADRLHNMRTLDKVIPHKRQRIARETLDIYAPIANRLGMYEFYAQLEDLAFAALYPRRYRIIARAVEQVYGRHQELISTLQQKLTQTIAQRISGEVKISGRTKHLYSIYRKMLRRHSSLANITDIYGFRVVVPTVESCYQALGIVHSLYKPLFEKFKDYIAAPKFNGYQSLHTVLFGPYGAPIEIQIRTATMDQIAKSGIASHWLYKSGEDALNSAQSIAQRWIANILEIQHHTVSSAEFLESVKLDLYPDKVFVFTPKGKIMELVWGATALDFAYAVHTDIGNRCVAVRINREFAPLSSTLSNGQIVSIITAAGTEPNPNWLNFVVTHKARHCIRQYLKSKRLVDLISLGKKLLEQALVDIACDLTQLPSERVEHFLKQFNFKTLNDLYENIGLGNHLATLVAYQLINAGKEQNFAEYPCSRSLAIREAQGSAITFARCCHPIPGDPIVGYLNSGYGLEVHTQDCPNFAKLNRNRNRQLPVHWADEVKGEFNATIEVEITNHPGALIEVAQAIAKAHANIKNIHSDESNRSYLRLSIDLSVKNLAHFERIKRHVSNIAMVTGVDRKKSEKITN